MAWILLGVVCILCVPYLTQDDKNVRPCTAMIDSSEGAHPRLSSYNMEVVVVGKAPSTYSHPGDGGDRPDTSSGIKMSSTLVITRSTASS